MYSYLTSNLGLLPVLVWVAEGSTKLCRYYYYVDGRRVMGSYFCLHEQTCCNNRQCCEAGGTGSFSVHHLWYFWLCILGVVVIIAGLLIRFINRKYRLKVYPRHPHHAMRHHRRVVTQAVGNPITAYYPGQAPGHPPPYPGASIQYPPPPPYDDARSPYSTWPRCQPPSVIMTTVHPQTSPRYLPGNQTNCGTVISEQRYSTVCTTHM